MPEEAIAKFTLAATFESLKCIDYHFTYLLKYKQKQKQPGVVNLPNLQIPDLYTLSKHKWRSSFIPS